LVLTGLGGFSFGLNDSTRAIREERNIGPAWQSVQTLCHPTHFGLGRRDYLALCQSGMQEQEQ
jgi:hypothetical protein